ncbi:MAG: sulfatase family protein [Myxococcota bacterium]
MSGPFVKRVAQATLAVAASLALGCAGDPPPNIVIILADDLGWGDLGAYGATRFATPRIDALAAEGMRFTDAHAASAACSASRYALLTGRYAWRQNLFGALLHESPLAIDPERTTLADLARQAGFATAALGKWHLGFGTGTPDWNGRLEPGPLELGFDHYFGIPVVNSHPPFVFVEDHAVVGLDPADPLEIRPGPMSPEGKMLDRTRGGAAARALYRDRDIGPMLAERAEHFIEANAGGRFLLYLATTHIHHPFTPGAPFRGVGEAGAYGEFVSELDWMVGRVLDALEREGVADETLVVFTSDNGGSYLWGAREAWQLGHRPNAELLGQKFDVWEGGQRVPFIARWPGRVPAGAVSDTLVSLVDLAATVASLTGQPLPDDAAEDSADLTAALLDPTPDAPPRNHLVLASGGGLLALRFGDHVFVDGPGSGGFGWRRHARADLPPTAAWQQVFAFAGRPNSDLRADGRFRPGAPGAQLYDLSRDPSQAVNRLADDPERARQMQEALRQAVRAGRTRPPG